MSTTNGKPYPTSYEIEDIFENQTGIGTRRETMTDILDDNGDFKVMGYDHHFADQHKGKEAVLKNLMEALFDMIDGDTFKYEVSNVFGGGEEPWAVIEGKGTAKTKQGKKFVNENVYIVRFNKHGKITKLRVYYDTHHIHNAAVAHGLTS